MSFIKFPLTDGTASDGTNRVRINTEQVSHTIEYQGTPFIVVMANGERFSVTDASTIAAIKAALGGHN